MRGNHLGSLPTVELAAGFTPAATLFLTSAKRRYEQPLRKVPTVYRKESRPVAKRPADEREPSGFPLILHAPEIRRRLPDRPRIRIAGGCCSPRCPPPNRLRRLFSS